MSTFTDTDPRITAIFRLVCELAEGRYKTRLVGTTDTSGADDEIAAIAVGLETISELLADQVAENESLLRQLSEINSQLEHRVAERTAALAAANMEGQHRADELRLLYEISTMLTQTELRQATLASVAVEQLRLVADADECALALVSPDDPTVLQVVAVRVANHLRPARLVDDTYPIENYPDNIVTGNTLVFHLTTNGEVRGVIEIFQPRNPSCTHVVGAAINQIAVILENARLYEEVTRTAQQLRVADQHRSRFIANMSHELRTPLNAIIGFSDALLLEISGEITPEQSEDLHIIRKNGHHLLRLINDILDISKINAGKMELEITPGIDLAQLVKKAVGQVRSLFADKLDNLTLLVNVPSEPVVADVDETRITQVVLNLLSNAIKFTERGSISITMSKHSTWIEIEVEDTGIGIPTSHLNVIFDEFVQVDDRLRHQGTGLGLPITRHLIEMHGGSIRASSMVGVGSVFTLQLPIHQDRSGTDYDVASYSPSKQSIMVVDNDATVIALYQRALGEQFHVVGITDSRAALEMTRRIRPQIVLLDVFMPDLDGWQVLTALRRHEESRRVPVLIYGLDYQQQHAFAFAAHDILIAPPTRADLLYSFGKLLAMPQTVLVVDSSNMLDAIHQLLPDMTVVRGENGNIIKQANNFQPDVIILSLANNPASGSNPVRILHELKQDAETQHIPVIACLPRRITAEERISLSQAINQVMEPGPYSAERLIGHILEYQGRWLS